MSTSRAAITLVMWAVYERPEDYPNNFVARSWLIRGGAVLPTEQIILKGDLEGVRAEMRKLGLTKLGRHPADDPVIVETWL